MRKHTQELVLPYTPEQMFDLVSDIKRYPEFVRWIAALRVSNPRVLEGVHHCVGEAVVAFKGFSHTFATKVVADRVNNTIEVSLERGPFKHLVNSWHFAKDGEDTTRVFFNIEYEFSNFILQGLARANHEYAIKQIVGTFLEEAQRRYGSQGNAAS